MSYLLDLALPKLDFLISDIPDRFFGLIFWFLESHMQYWRQKCCAELTIKGQKQILGTKEEEPGPYSGMLPSAT